MLSIFDIPTKKEDLSSVNQGIADLRYDEVQSLRNLSDDAANSRFSGQEITFRWDYANGKWWIPSRSYFRIRVKLTKDGTVPLDQNDQIAPNMGMADSMIQQVQYKLADKTVEDISNYYPQVAALKARLGKTAQWLKTTGTNLNFWESSPLKRQQHICQDGYLEADTAQQHNMTPEVTYRTELGLPAAATVQYDRQARTLAFAAVGGFDCSQSFKLYDFIVLKDVDVIGGDTNRFRMVMIVAITDAANLSVVPFSFANGAGVFPAGAANIDLWRIRYSEMGAITALNTAADVYLANNQLQSNIFSNVHQEGQLLLMDRAAGNRAGQFLAFAGQQDNGGNETDHDLHTSVDSVGAGAVNNQQKFGFNFTRWKYTTAEDLGFPAGAYGVGVKALDGASQQRYEMYFSVADASVRLPDLRQIFRRGDFVMYKLVGGDGRVGMVWAVDVLGNDGITVNDFAYAQVLHIIPSDELGANEGFAGVGGVHTSTLIGRVQLGGPELPDRRRNDARNVTEFELIWKPALSVFDLPHALPGSAKNEIVITPFADTIYQAKAIESVDGLGKTHREDYVLEIQDMRLYNAVCEGPLVSQAQYILDLQETRCQNIPITTAARSQWTIDVSPSLNAITVAFQDQSAVQLPQYSNTRFKVRNDQELDLEEFYVRISQLQRPQPNADLLYLEYRGQDLLTEVYSRNLFYNGGYYDSSQETLKEWRERGWYLHYAVPRTGTDRSTRCNISTKFRSTGTNSLANNANILVFHHYKKVCIIQLDQGRVTAMRISNA